MHRRPCRWRLRASEARLLPGVISIRSLGILKLPGLAWALIDLHEKGVKVRVYLDNKSGLMHHKFAVIDGQAVITGSYNWTQAAEDVNLENVVILRCGCLSSEFSQRFAENWSGR